MKTRREVLKAGAATLVVGVPIAVVASAQAPIGMEQMFGGPAGGSMTQASEMHHFTFDFLVTGDRETARKVMNHFQSFIENSEGWPAKQTGINTSKIMRVE